MDISTITLSFLPLLVILGVRSTFYDFKKGIIKNWDLFFSLSAGGCLYVYLILFKGVEIDPVLFVGNLCIAMSIGLILYFTETWGAGDAKLFIVYSFLFPFPLDRRIIPFSSLVIFANTIMIVCLVVITVSIVFVARSYREYIKKCTKKMLDFNEIRPLIYSFFLILSFSWVVPYILSFWSAYFSPLVYILLTYVSYSVVYHILQYFQSRRLLYLIITLGIVSRFFIFPNAREVFWAMIASTKTIAIYTVFFRLLDFFFMADDRSKKENRTENTIILAPHMFVGVLLTHTHFLKGVLKLMSWAWK